MPDRRTIHCTALLLAASLWAGSAAAQVTRCSDPVTGKITYTDGDCAAGQARKEVAPRQSPEDIQRERDQAQEAMRLKQERRALEAAQAVPAPVEKPRQDADRQRPPDPAQSAECAQARQALKAARARDPSLYDTNTRQFSCRGEVLSLTPREHAVMELLIRVPGKTVSKKEMSDKLSTLDETITASALEIYIVRLRKKLENTGAQIVTLRGLGYMLTHVAA